LFTALSEEVRADGVGLVEPLLAVYFEDGEFPVSLSVLPLLALLSFFIRDDYLNVETTGSGGNLAGVEEEVLLGPSVKFVRHQIMNNSTFNIRMT